MNDMLISMGASAILAVLKESIKNAKTKAKFESVMKKIYTTIKSVYPEFDN